MTRAMAVAASVVVSTGISDRLSAPGQSRSPVSTYRIINAYPHDAEAYTQGLVYRDGFLFESTGLHGRSSLRKVRLETGEVLQQRRVDAAHFAEGLTEWGGRLLQLTWQSRIGFVYNQSSFAVEGTFTYAGEGWGLTHDGTRLILSDGTDTLRFLDPSTFKEIGRVVVRDGTTSIRNLNELEYVGTELYANVWHSDRIAKIAPDSGHVVGWIDLRGLLPSMYQRSSEAVLNGIAYDAARGRLFVTGKLWPKVFEITVQ